MINKYSQVENYTSCDVINPQYDEFSNERERLNKFAEVCFTLGAISTKLNSRIDDVNNTDQIDEEIIKKLTKLKENLRLNLCLPTVENQCYDINEILIGKIFF